MKYYISYGRGDVVEFATLKEAKEWQVNNIFDNYSGEDYSDDKDDIAVSYKWIKSDYGYEFALFNHKGEQLDTDTSDGAGWYIEKDED